MPGYGRAGAGAKQAAGGDPRRFRTAVTRNPPTSPMRFRRRRCRWRRRRPSRPPSAAELGLAATNPVQSRTPTAPASGGGYLVQVSSQRNEADAQASYRALQGKFPTVLGSHAPLIKRADLGDKGVYYRAMVGPFGSPEEASQFCGNLKTAGGQCVVQRN